MANLIAVAERLRGASEPKPIPSKSYLRPDAHRVERVPPNAFITDANPRPGRQPLVSETRQRRGAWWSHDEASWMVTVNSSSTAGTVMMAACHQARPPNVFK